MHRITAPHLPGIFHGRHWRAVVALGALAVAVLVLAGSAGASGGVTVTYATRPGSTPTYIFPLQSGEWFTFANDEEFGYLMYRPLYWIGNNGSPVYNAELSLAAPPVYSVSNGHTVAKITLKPYKWSDGQPLTTRDISFWMNLLKANKLDWGDYIPGLFPDNVVSITYPTKSTFVVTFNKVYNHKWLTYDELDQIFPAPQHDWDRTSLTGPIRNYDTTTAGAKKVYAFLDGQSKQGSTWATSKLWQVVDGPWKVSEYTTATQEAVLVRNDNYSGKVTGNVTKVILEPFTTTAAEFNALKAGSLDFGFIPEEDTTPGQINEIKSEGYDVKPWYIFGWNFWPVNFANPKVGMIFKQLYVRQAMQHLIDQKTWVNVILHGFGLEAYSAIPLTKNNPYLDAFLRVNHYPYSTSVASQLLQKHGWTGSGVRTCTKPGSGPSDCGAGIKAGTKLDFTLEYGSGLPALKQEAIAFQTAASQAGMSISLIARPVNQAFADYFSCMGAPASACHWEIDAARVDTLYGWYPYYYPVGVANWATGAGFNGGQYSNKTMDKLLFAGTEATGAAGAKALTAVEHYVALQLPTLWAPAAPYEVAAISHKLHVPYLGSMTNIYPIFYKSG